MQHCTVLGIQQEPVGKTQRIVSVLLQQSSDGIMNDDNDFGAAQKHWNSHHVVRQRQCLTVCGNNGDPIALGELCFVFGCKQTS